MNHTNHKSAGFTIRWVLTHDPIALFEEAARRFADIIHLESNGRMQVQVFTPTEYGHGRRVSAEEVANDLAAGKIEMSQTYTAELGKRHDRLWVLDLPFLFRDHQHAAQVLDHQIGQTLLDGLVPYNIRGLAFTYSGGYRIISSTTHHLASSEDFSSLNIRVSDNPVAKAFFDQLGATSVPAPLHKIPTLTTSGEINAAESTWPRYWDMQHYQSQANVMETSHSLFLTALLVNEKFYQSLPDDLKSILQSAALRTARLERAKSISDAEQARQYHLAEGGTVSIPNAQLQSKMTEVSAKIYHQFSDRFGPQLIKDIQETQSKNADNKKSATHQQGNSKACRLG